MEKAIKNQHLRLASIPPDQRTPEMISIMILVDVQEFVANDLTTNKGKQIGFKNN